MEIKFIRVPCIDTLSMIYFYFLYGKFMELLQVNATACLHILEHKILSEVSAIAEPSNIWHLTDRYCNGRE